MLAGAFGLIPQRQAQGIKSWLNGFLALLQRTPLRLSSESKGICKQLLRSVAFEQSLCNDAAAADPRANSHPLELEIEPDV